MQWLSTKTAAGCTYDPAKKNMAKNLKRKTAVLRPIILEFLLVCIIKSALFMCFTFKNS